MWWLLACSGGKDGGPRPEPTAEVHTGVGDHSGTAAPHTGEAHSGADVVDFAEPGPSAFTETEEAWQPAGCGQPLSRRFFTPDPPATAVTVVVAHGFNRSQDDVVDLARHLASWGMPVATTTSCHSELLDTAPAMDAVDLIALADDAGAAERLYVGHSSGGLRAVLAAFADPQAVGVLGLDLVDFASLAATAAPELDVPLAGLAGEPSNCNRQNNGDAVYAAGGDPVLHVTDADHCDFEWPTDEGCEFLCNDPAELPGPQVRATARAFATAWVAWRSGADPAGEAYWSPGGAAHDAALASGAVR